MAHEYAAFLEVLREVRDAVPNFPTQIPNELPWD
jgi:hypothetical protein